MFLWAEDIDRSDWPVKPVTAPDFGGNGAGKPSNGRQRTPKIPSHPNQASIVNLRSSLASEFESFDTRHTQPANAVVWLPSVDGAPQSRRNVSRQIVSGIVAAANGGAERKGAGSSEGSSVQPTAVARPQPTLTPWQVTGLALPAMPALRFLSHLARTPGTGAVVANAGSYRVRIGNDLFFWSNVAKFAVEMLVGEHYLPGLQVQDAGAVQAKWLPQTLDTRIEQRRLQLIEAMPPVCRAYNLNNPDEARYPSQVVDDFLAAMLDVAIRRWTGYGEIAESAALSQEPPIVWMRTLLGESSQVALPPQPVHELYQEWRHWTERLYLVRDANIRICFVLEEPATDLNSRVVGSDPISDRLGFIAEPSVWRLRYFLQARDNPELMVPASDVWSSTHGYVLTGGRQIDQPQERMLTGLGVASRFFSPIERSLHSPQPEHCLLTTEEAYRFLREISSLLESSGFGVILPEWWNSQRSMRLALRLRMRTADEFIFDDADDEPVQFRMRQSSTTIRRGPRVDYSWELTLGGEQLSREEFDQLFAMKTPLLRMRERWVELDPEQVNAAQRFLTEPSQIGSMSLLSAVQIAQRYQDVTPRHEPDAPASASLEGIPRELVPSSVAGALGLEDVVLTGWVEEVLFRLRNAAPLTELEEPDGFVGELRPYQRRGLGWLFYLRNLGLGACLADDMGLGKTIQTIALLLQVRNAGNGRKPVPPALLICPTSVVANWRREIERFAPSLRVLVHHGHTRSAGADFAEELKATDLVVTSYGTARRDVDLLSKFEWSDLILDEAQNIKTPTAKQTLAVQLLSGRNRIALTGTPVENRLTELWSIMRFLNPDYIGSRESFRRNYVLPIERYNDEERTDELRRIVQPFLLRRLKSNPDIISDLPEKNEMIVYCSLSTEQAELYEKAVNESLTEINSTDGIQRRGKILALLTRLKQIANHPAQYLKQSGPLAGRSGKLARLTEMLDEALSVGDSALIFTQYVEMGRLLQTHLAKALGLEALFLHGGTSAQQRDKMVQEFQREDGPPVFVLSLRAGGSGLNLTRANHVFHYDRWWNPAVENQATDRAFRIGQVRNVQVHKFVAAGTLEESIHELIESKQALAESIVGSGEEWLTELDTNQLRNLISLRHDAIEGESL
ncbi:MAG: DEAD/DEAH box helicase [Caldilineaceae bacterium]